jgi:hypothetical protein
MAKRIAARGRNMQVPDPTHLHDEELAEHRRADEEPSKIKFLAAGVESFVYAQQGADGVDGQVSRTT